MKNIGIPGAVNMMPVATLDRLRGITTIYDQLGRLARPHVVSNPPEERSA